LFLRVASPPSNQSEFLFREANLIQIGQSELATDGSFIIPAKFVITAVISFYECFMRVADRSPRRWQDGWRLRE
jgi:hypothetical protein